MQKKGGHVSCEIKIVTYFNQELSYMFDTCHKREDECDASNLPISAAVNDEP
jgi:hypothetical protein